jgi:NADH dehydrogenase FAD-containing subunit
MRVVIVGGGFAAVKFAKTLRNKLRGSECEILLFNRENHMDGVPSPLGGCRWSFD